MQFLKDLGFIVKRTNFGESDRYITIFTKYNGKVEVVAKGVRKLTSRRASSVELLNLVRFQAVRTSKNHILTEVELISSYETLKNNLPNVQILFLLCELIDKLCPLGQKHDDVFELIKTTLARVKTDQEPAVSDFQKNILSLLGFWDGKKEFHNDEDVRQFIESVIERKLKSKNFFKA